MAAVIEVIGVISGLLGIIQFGIDNFAEDPGEGSTFKIAVGLDGTNDLSNAGGDLPDVRVWNQNGEFVGMEADPGSVNDGNLGEVHVDHENQGVYTLFSANNDAICIAWVTTSWSDDRGGNQYAVQGDMGYYCGASWFYSGMYYNSDEDQWSKPAEEQPKCFWIDGNGDQPNSGFQVRWPAFSTSEVDPDAPAEDRDPTQKCDGISFGMRTEDDPSAINYWTKKRSNMNPSGAASQHAKKSFRPVRRSAAMASQLVLGDYEGLSARFVCESGTSVGPDIANLHEGLFCDMDEKKLYNLCDQTTRSGCFDLDSQSLKPASNATVSSFKMAAVDNSKKYSKTLDWRKNKDARL